jgi:hypothetical protein
VSAQNLLIVSDDDAKLPRGLLYLGNLATSKLCVIHMPRFSLVSGPLRQVLATRELRCLKKFGDTNAYVLPSISFKPTLQSIFPFPTLCDRQASHQEPSSLRPRRGECWPAPFTIRCRRQARSRRETPRLSPPTGERRRNRHGRIAAIFSTEV